MRINYRLEVLRNVGLVEFEKREQEMKNLLSLVNINGLNHKDINQAFDAAKAISQNPIVTHVELRRIEESPVIIFINGERAE